MLSARSSLAVVLFAGILSPAFCTPLTQPTNGPISLSDHDTSIALNKRNPVPPKDTCHAYTRDRILTQGSRPAVNLQEMVFVFALSGGAVADYCHALSIGMATACSQGTLDTLPGPSMMIGNTCVSEITLRVNDLAQTSWELSCANRGMLCFENRRVPICVRLPLSIASLP